MTRHGKYRKALLNSENRRKYGCITTWEAPDGMTLTLHRTGLTQAANLRVAAAIALAENEDYAPFAARRCESMPRALVEAIMLSQAGLPRDLLHPRLTRRMTA